ncbi:MAG: AbrB/MazE/SpoVT family DNA-binding domain-containing protein [Kiritimatiellia bacterium]
MKTTVSEKGQVTIPKSLRDQLGLRKGTVLDMRMEEGHLVVVKRQEGSPFQRWRGRGRLPVGDSVDDYLNRIRDADGG